MKKLMLFLISVFIVCSISLNSAGWGNVGWDKDNNKEYIRYLPFINTLNDSLGVMWFNLSDSNLYYVDKSGVHIIGSGSGIKSDSAIYADSAFHLFADSNYTIADLIADTVDVDSIKARVIAVDTVRLTSTKYMWNNGHYYYFSGGFKTNESTTHYGTTNLFGTVNLSVIRNRNTNPLMFLCGYFHNDSIINLLTGANGDTVYTVDSLNNMRVYNNLTVDDTLKTNVINIDSIFYTSADTFFADTNSIFDLSDASKVLFPAGDYMFDVLYPTQPNFGSIGKSDTTYAYVYGDTIKSDSINTRTVVVGDTLLVDGVKLYNIGVVLKTYSFSSSILDGYYTSARAFVNRLNMPIIIDAGYRLYDDSVMIVLKTKDTVLTADSLNNMRVYNNLTVDDTLKTNVINIDSIFYTSADTFFADTNSIFDLSDASKVLFPAGDYMFDVLYPTQPNFGSIGKSDTTYAYVYGDTIKSDSINTRTVVVGDTLLVDGVKLYNIGVVLKTYSFSSSILDGYYTSARAFVNRLNMPIIIDAGYRLYDDSVMIVLKTKDTVLTADSLNNMRVYNNLTVDDTLKSDKLQLGGGIYLDKADNRNDSLFFIVGSDTFVAVKK